MQSDMEIRSYQGFGGLKLGMNMEQVRALLGKPDAIYLKTSDCVLPTYAYDRLGIQVSYKAPGVCDAFELRPPSKPTIHRRGLLKQPLGRVRAFLDRLDPDFEADDTGMTFFSLGIALYVPDIDDSPDAKVESVLVFERGYYNSP
jgi:hypothetical protein